MVIVCAVVRLELAARSEHPRVAMNLRHAELAEADDLAPKRIFFLRNHAADRYADQRVGKHTEVERA
jgi:hypothetical protein